MSFMLNGYVYDIEPWIQYDCIVSYLTMNYDIFKWLFEFHLCLALV